MSSQGQANVSESNIQIITRGAIKSLSGCKYFYSATVIGAIKCEERVAGIQLTASEFLDCVDKVAKFYNTEKGD